METYGEKDIESSKEVRCMKENRKKLLKEIGYDTPEENIDFRYVSFFQKLSEEFILEFQDKIDWGIISKTQKLSEEFIRKNKNFINWRRISENQTLSEDFIREYKERV